MTAPTETADRSDLRTCGCCGRTLPADRVAELGTTPGVFICAGCALWAARRARPLSLLGRLPILRALRRRHRHEPSGGIKAHVAIPVLPSADLDRTAAFYAPTGFLASGRHPGYLLLHNAEVELHFAQPGTVERGECYIHVGDAQALHNQLREHGIDGLGPITDQDYGLREFVLTDPDGNRVRFGSPIG
jgi:hypothetical protein